MSGWPFKNTVGLMIGTAGSHFITVGTTYLDSYAIKSTGGIGAQVGADEHWLATQALGLRRFHRGRKSPAPAPTPTSNWMGQRRCAALQNLADQCDRRSIQAYTEEFKAFGIQLELAELKDAYAHRSTPRAGKYSSGEDLLDSTSYRQPLIRSQNHHLRFTSPPLTIRPAERLARCRLAMPATRRIQMRNSYRTLIATLGAVILALRAHRFQALNAATTKKRHYTAVCLVGLANPGVTDQ